MVDTLKDDYANYNSTNHMLGQNVHLKIETARSNMLKALGLDQTHYMVFTSGASESINLVNQGALKAYHRSLTSIATLSTDHKVSIEVLNVLSSQIPTVFLEVLPNGLIDEKALIQHLKLGPSLINVCAVNNETGVIQPLENLIDLVHQYGSLIHVDASQMPGKLEPMNLSQVDFMSISAHKFYGPKGAGALIIKNNRRVESIFYGSHQEYGVRPGTLATHQILGMSKALKYALETYEMKEEKIKKHRDLIVNFFESKGAKINGDHTCFLTFNILLPKTMNLAVLEEKVAPEIAFSFGSACQTTNLAPSHVLKAMGLTPDEISRCIRLSLGLEMNDEDIKTLLHSFARFL
jgi:cysteine desulfurase